KGEVFFVERAREPSRIEGVRRHGGAESAEERERVRRASPRGGAPGLGRCCERHRFEPRDPGDGGDSGSVDRALGGPRAHREDDHRSDRIALHEADGGRPHQDVREDRGRRGVPPDPAGIRPRDLQPVAGRGPPRRRARDSDHRRRSRAALAGAGGAHGEGPWARDRPADPRPDEGRGRRRVGGHRHRGGTGPCAEGAPGRARRASLCDRMARGGWPRRRGGGPPPEAASKGGGGVKTTVIGAYPKIGDDAGGQELRRALHRRDRGEIGEAELAKVYDDVTRSTIAEIEAAGVDVVNDGQIRWDDLLAPFARTWSGVERGPLERFYDNNTYYRQPVISGPIVTDGRSLVRDFTFARGVAKTQLKAAVPGPLTFATLTSHDEHFGSLEDRVLAI